MEETTSPPTQKSEVAALMAQIEAENAAAHRALHDPAYGATKHQFITARMQRLGQISEQLISQLGHELAIPLIIDAMNNVL